MKQKFWYNCESNYDGPYRSAEDAMDAAGAVAKPDEVIEIHQLVAISPKPKRTWRKR